MSGTSFRRSAGIEGGCACGALRFALRAPPLFTHVCHCRDCQRRTGSAFSITTIVLRDDLAITSGSLAAKAVSARSTAFVCAECETAVYVASTTYPVTFVLRPGTLDDPSTATPQAHIWVRRKQPWVVLPDGVPAFAEEYETETTWPAVSLARLREAEQSKRT
jgi:hypothetical protein